MPSLMASHQNRPVALPQRMVSCDTAPAAITLSFGGVDFKLIPIDSNAEMSCKNKSDCVELSLNSFTGTLTVSKAMLANTIIATTESSTAPTVEDDPDSPDGKKSIPKASPKQQTLPFKTGKKSTKNSSSKRDGTDKRRKAGVVVTAPDPKSTKRSRIDNKNSLPPISLGQFSQTTQLTQNDTDRYEDNNSSTLVPTHQTDMRTITPSIKAASVQEILDRDCVQSSGESVATVKDSDDRVSGMKIDNEGINVSEKESHEINENISSGNDVESGTFSYPAPPARWGHTMTQVDNGQILVYGGQSFDLDGNPVILSDVHVYDPKNGGSWHKPINCRGEARQWHSATYIPARQQIIAFGGETIDPIKKGSKKNKVVTSDTLRVLDTEIMLWYPPAASGDVPTGRSGHTATFFPSTNELILFGGVRGSKWLNTVSVLDVTRWIWTTPNIVGTAPKPRSYHSATAVGPQKLVVFGGNNKTSCFNSVHVLEAIEDDNSDSKTGGNTCTWKWSNPTIRGKAPFPRTGHTATLLEDGKTIMVYGGWDPNEEDELTGEDNIFKGSYLLDTIEWTWKKGPEPQSGGSGSPSHFVEDCGAKRCGHTATLNPENNEVFVFGGRIPGEVLAGDVQRLVPPQEKTLELEGC